MIELWYFIQGLGETIWEFKEAIFFMVGGGSALLYVIYRGRKSSYYKQLPKWNADHRFALLAFSKETSETFSKLPPLQKALTVTIVLGLGLSIGYVIAQDISSPRHTKETLTEKSTLVYQTTTYVDAEAQRFSVQFQSEAKPACDPYTQTDTFTLDAGDGTTYTVDCKDVTTHRYAKPGTYTATYLRNGAVEASVTVTVPIDE